MYEGWITPQPIIDLDIVERNIKSMAEKLKQHGIRHRPHIKSSKSVQIAAKQLVAGAIGITAAKLSEAEVFVNAGIPNILIAYSLVGEVNLRRFAELHRQSDLLTTVDSFIGAEGLSRVGRESGKPVRVLVEVDGGLHRGGRQPGEDAAGFARSVHAMEGIQVEGVMNYAGTIYQHTTSQGFIDAVREEAALLRKTVDLMKAYGVPVDIVSSGSSPSALFCKHLQGVTEVRAGNYVFFDASGIGMGLAAEEDCALRVLATVISTPLPGLATIDAGTKTLTSDKAHGRSGFGIVVGRPGIEITGLNEEHGFLKFDPLTERLEIGEQIEIIPNHSCIIPNLYNEIQGVRKGQAVEVISIDARGCNY
ncbi:amino acid processing protein [Paenibacillus yonginensis]|uniref:Amino acid processing protein n=1 Tax=Paenibacillus yonginensis TaxID=1462996 RepID=A0A1B1MZW2_9BACL|nr:alanine racemase [Paenibacillus yonginensis]ANS74696.1 amino acid processing protein [Paenibacillus yonginensis]